MSVVLMLIFVFVLEFIGVRFVFAELEPDENGIIKVTEANIYSKVKYFYNQNPSSLIKFGAVGCHTLQNP